MSDNTRFRPPPGTPQDEPDIASASAAAAPARPEHLKAVPKITVLPVMTSLDVPSERVLNSALTENLQGCVVVGVTADGDMYFASSFADGADILWWLEKAKKALLEFDLKPKEV